MVIGQAHVLLEEVTVVVTEEVDMEEVDMEVVVDMEAVDMEEVVAVAEVWVATETVPNVTIVKKEAIGLEIAPNHHKTAVEAEEENSDIKIAEIDLRVKKLYQC